MWAHSGRLLSHSVCMNYGCSVLFKEFYSVCFDSDTALKHEVKATPRRALQATYILGVGGRGVSHDACAAGALKTSSGTTQKSYIHAHGLAGIVNAIAAAAAPALKPAI